MIIKVKFLRRFKRARDVNQSPPKNHPYTQKNPFSTKMQPCEVCKEFC